MPIARLKDGFEENGDWTLLSPHKIPAVSDNHISRGPTEDEYVTSSLRTRFGTLVLCGTPGNTRSGVMSANRKKSVHQQEQSPLFRLPFELRLRIYEIHFQVPTLGSAAKISRHLALDSKPTKLEILLTCRRALIEAEEIFYAINRFSVHDSQDFLASLGSRRRSVITSLTLPVVTPASLHVGLRQLHTLPSLASLHIQRRVSAKYSQVSAWAVMAPQLIAEIRKMENLAEVKILTPEAESLTEHEMTRKKKLDEIDQRISSAVSGQGPRTGVVG